MVVMFDYDNKIKVYDVNSESLLLEFLYSAGAKDYGWAEFSADSKYIVAGGAEGIGVWRLNLTSSVGDAVAGSRGVSWDQIRPNPARNTIEIPFEVDRATSIDVSLYDSRGNLVEELIRAEYDPGSYRLNFDVSDHPSGIYFVALRSSFGVVHRELHIIR